MPKIIEQAWPERFYVSLETEKETEVFVSRVHSINLIESLGSLSPVLVIRFQDQFGSIVTTSTLYPDGVYTLNIGRNLDEAIPIDFTISKNRFQNLQRGYMDDIGCSLFFISKRWVELFNTKYVKGWEEVKYSDVVNEIAGEIGFSEIDVESTDGKYNVIQPYWTNQRMIEWLSIHSKSQSQGVHGFEYSVNFEDVFFFKSYNELMSKEPKKEIVLGPSFLPERSEDTVQATDLTIEQNYAEVMKEGGSGYSYSYFDWYNKEYIEEDLKVSETNQSQLSDWYYIAESHENKGNFKHLFRDLDAEARIENRLSHLSNSIQYLHIRIEGDIELHVGDIVNVIIPPSSYHEFPINEFYSGYYLISEVEHQITFVNKENKFDTILKLSRQGVDDTDLSGFVKSNMGKVLG